jgi:hypothetical protein
MAAHGDLNGLRARVDAGDQNAAARLAGVLAMTTIPGLS